MSRQWTIVLVVVAGLFLGAAALSRFAGDVDQVGVGAKAPEFRLPEISRGDSVSLRERYTGKVTLVNIWATWCVPCRAEMPSMEQLYTALAPRGFAIAAVSIDEGPAE